MDLLQILQTHIEAHKLVVDHTSVISILHGLLTNNSHA